MTKLLIDLDGNESKFDDFLKKLWIIKYLNFQPRYIRVFRTTRGFHIHMKFNNLFSNLDIVALQAIMGSDPHREAFNYRRIKEGLKDWNVLFREKYIITVSEQGISREIASKEIFDEKLTKLAKEKLK